MTTEYITQHERDDLRDEVAELKAQLAAVTAERDALKAVPVEAIREAHHFCSVAFHPSANLDVMLGDWWEPLTKWLEKVQP